MELSRLAATRSNFQWLLCIIDSSFDKNSEV